MEGDCAVNDKLGLIIQEKRKLFGLTQEELAEKIEKTPGFIGQIERGICMPSIDTLTQLISILAIDANEIFYEEKPDSLSFCELNHLVSQWNNNDQLFLLEFIRLMDKRLKFSKEAGDKNESCNLR